MSACYVVRKEGDDQPGTETSHWPAPSEGYRWATYCGIGFRYELPSRPVTIAGDMDHVTCSRCQRSIEHQRRIDIEWALERKVT